MRLKELRMQKGLKQKDIAMAIGCATNNYARYERGDREPDIETLIRFSKFFNVSIDYIVGNY